jgi:15-cis-phytoene synthase
MDSFEHCQALVRAADKDRFLATLFAPERCRRSLFALYAFNVEVGRVREQARQPLPGEIRLQWWRDVFSSSGAGEFRAHPVAAALTDTIVRHRLPLAVFSDLVEAHAFDLYDDPMATVAELEGYAGKTSSALIVLATLILDGDGSSTVTLARHAGIAAAIAGLLGNFALHASRHQLYVPLELLDRHGARAEDVFAGKLSPELLAALAELRLHARRHLVEAKELIASAPIVAAPAFLPASVAAPVLDRMDKRDYDPFKPFEFPQWRRQWTIWRAARRPRRMFG